MTKLLRPNCKQWCGTLSQMHWQDYKDLPAYRDREVSLTNTYWKTGLTPYNGNIIQIWDYPKCRDNCVSANIICKEKNMETWYVWKIGGGVPTAKWTNEEGARKEAERLCNIHGGEFVICKAIASCSRDSIKWTELDNVPF